MYVPSLTLLRVIDGGSSVHADLPHSLETASLVHFPLLCSVRVCHSLGGGRSTGGRPGGIQGCEWRGEYAFTYLLAGWWSIRWVSSDCGTVFLTLVLTARGPVRSPLSFALRLSSLLVASRCSPGANVVVLFLLYRLLCVLGLPTPSALLHARYITAGGMRLCGGRFFLFTPIMLRELSHFFLSRFAPVV